MKELYVESGTQDSHLLEEEELRTVISAKVAINECIEIRRVRTHISFLRYSNTLEPTRCHSVRHQKMTVLSS